MPRAGSRALCSQESFSVHLQLFPNQNECSKEGLMHSELLSDPDNLCFNKSVQRGQKAQPDSEKSGEVESLVCGVLIWRVGK